MSFPHHRPRRLRTTPAMRRLTAETPARPAELILPAFIREGLAEPNPITSMPGVVQHTTDSLKRAAAEAVELGLGGIMLFGIPEVRDATGSAGAGPRRRAEQGHPRRPGRGRRRAGGHERRLPGRIHRPRPLRRARRRRLRGQRRHAGDLRRDGRGPGRGRRPRAGPLRHDGRPGRRDPPGPRRRRSRNIAVLAYAAKYASAFYGPFREAVDSAADRRPPHLPDGRRQPPRGRSARWSWTWPRAPTWSWSSRP